MARIDIRFFTQRDRKTGEPYFLWQPSATWRAKGWKAAGLIGADGEPSPLAVAIVQARWLNAIFDAQREGDAQMAARLRDEWSAGGDGMSFSNRWPGLGSAPAIAYDIPGAVAVQARTVVRRSFAALIAEYKNSIFFTELGPRSQDGYSAHLKALDTLIGKKPVAQLRRGLLRKTYETLLRVHGKHVANGRMRVLSVALSYAVEVEWIDANPLLRFRMSKTPSGLAYIPEAVHDHLVATAIRMDRLSVAVGIMLANFTGQRRADLVRINEETYSGGRFVVRQEKRNKLVRVKAMRELADFLSAARPQFIARHGDLAAGLAKAKLRGRHCPQWLRDLPAPTLMIREETGLPLDKHAFTHLFIAVRAEAAKTMPECARYKLKNYRATAIVNLVRADCTLFQMCAVSGQSPQSIDMIMKSYVEVYGDDAIADEAIRKWEKRRERAGEGGGE